MFSEDLYWRMKGSIKIQYSPWTGCDTFWALSFDIVWTYDSTRIKFAMLRTSVNFLVLSRSFRPTTVLGVKKGNYFGHYILSNKCITVQETSISPNKIVVEGLKVDSPRAPFVAKPPKEAKDDACPLCKLGLKGLAYTVSLIFWIRFLMFLLLF